MNDILSETTMGLAEAGRRLPPSRSGRPPRLSTLLRWVLHGTKAPDGSIVRLEAIRLGSRWITSMEALRRWADRLTPTFGDQQPIPPRFPGQRRRAAERAGKRLEQMGA
jgi:hypothetical protein